MASSSTMDAVYEAPTSSRLLAKYQRVFALALLGVLVLLLMMVSGVVIRQQSRMLEDTFIRRGVATLEHLAALSQEPLATGKTADLSQVVQIAKLTDDDIEAIAILNAHGDIVAQTGRDILLPLDRSRVSSVVSARDYLRGMTRTFLGPVRSKTGGPLGVSYVRMSQ